VVPRETGGGRLLVVDPEPREHWVDGELGDAVI
jgi:hypothetical protein